MKWFHDTGTSGGFTFTKYNNFYFLFCLGRQQLREEEVGKIYPAKRLTLDQLDPNPTHVQTGQFVHLGEKLGCISAQADTIITRVSALSHTWAICKRSIFQTLWKTHFCPKFWLFNSFFFWFWWTAKFVWPRSKYFESDQKFLSYLVGGSELKKKTQVFHLSW